MDRVEFGVMLPNFLNSDTQPHPFYYALQYNLMVLNFEDIKNITMKAEKLGYHSLWISDNLSWETCRNRLEKCTNLPTLSSITMKIRLGTIILCNLYRHPVLTAKITSTLDFIPKGRFELEPHKCPAW